ESSTPPACSHSEPADLKQLPAFPTRRSSDLCSIQTDLARPSIAPYTATKGGLRNLTRAMTAEWAGDGLQINGLAPGYVRTEMTQDRKSTRLNSSHVKISYAVFCLKKKSY